MTFSEDDINRVGDSVPGVNPVLGMNLEDIVDSLKLLLFQAYKQPRLLMLSSTKFAVDAVAIASGQSAIKPLPGDRRFQNAAWRTSQFHKRLMQLYLAWCKRVEEWLGSTGLEGSDMARAQFALQIYLSSICPANTLASNPEAFNKAVDSKGLSLVVGLRQFVNDIRTQGGLPSIVDPGCFTLGQNIAVTEGYVISRTEQSELIHYSPLERSLTGTPILYVPTFLNHYYVADLTPDVSLVRYLLRQGFQVFAISWRNPEPEHKYWGLWSYAGEVDRHVETITNLVKCSSVHIAGVCGGGTIASVACGKMLSRSSKRVRSLTLLNTVLDYADEELGVLSLVNQRSKALSIRRVHKKGVLSERSVRKTFAMMSPEDSYWSFVRSSYLLGEVLPSHPLLFWASKQTNVAAQLHEDFLDIALANGLACEPGFFADKAAICLSDVSCPVYALGSLKDHITPWEACYRNTGVFGGDVDFVLTEGGHISPLTTKPDDKRLRYFVGGDSASTSSNWLNSANQVSGSWWFHWSDWLKRHSVKKLVSARARRPDQRFAIDRAPGEYAFT